MTNKIYTRLPLEGAYNVRELGGQPCPGGATNFGAFLRGDDLSHLTETDIAFLLEYGLVAVIDLRSAGELAVAKDPFAQDARVNYANISFMGENVSTAAADIPMEENYLQQAYLGMLETAQAEIVAAFTFIAAQKPGCVLFHCTGGKDRTGVLAALLLGLAGVAEEDILANYQTTYTFLRRNKELVGGANGYPESVMYSLPAYMEPALALIKEKYGTTENYLLTAGASPEVLASVKARLV